MCLWRFDPKMYRFHPLTNMHQRIKELDKSSDVEKKVILRRWQINQETSSNEANGTSYNFGKILNLDPAVLRWKFERCVLKTAQLIVSVWDLHLWPLDPLFMGIFRHCAFIYNTWRLYVSEQKCWQKCIDIFLSPSCIHVRNIEAVSRKLLGSSSGRVVKLLACRARGPGFDSRPRHLNFRDWLSSASKSRYGWKIAKSTLILKTTNQPTRKQLRYCDRTKVLIKLNYYLNNWLF